MLYPKLARKMRPGVAEWVVGDAPSHLNLKLRRWEQMRLPSSAKGKTREVVAGSRRVLSTNQSSATLQDRGHRWSILRANLAGKSAETPCRARRGGEL